MDGWISLYRQIKESWIWKDKEPFDKRSAWIDLLLTVNYKNKKIPFEKRFYRNWERTNINIYKTTSWKMEMVKT